VGVEIRDELQLISPAKVPRDISEEVSPVESHCKVFFLRYGKPQMIIKGHLDDMLKFVYIHNISYPTEQPNSRRYSRDEMQTM
jgi:hypothetical protein